MKKFSNWISNDLYILPQFCFSVVDKWTVRRVMDGQSVLGESKSQQTSRPSSHYEGLRLQKLLFHGKK